MTIARRRNPYHYRVRFARFRRLSREVAADGQHRLVRAWIIGDDDRRDGGIAYLATDLEEVEFWLKFRDEPPWSAQGSAYGKRGELSAPGPGSSARCRPLLRRYLWRA